MKFALFVALLITDFVLLLGIAISALFPKIRVWPPPKRNSWQFWISWILAAVGMTGPPLISVLDFETLGRGHWVRFFIGGLAILIGSGVAIWGTKTLSAHQSLGLKGTLVTRGPYQYSRNPQYAGFILMYAGVILVAYSFMALVTGTFVILLFMILPFSEETWLRQQYGKAYEEYCEKVPRFIGLRSFKPTKHTQQRNTPVT